MIEDSVRKLDADSSLSQDVLAKHIPAAGKLLFLYSSLPLLLFLGIWEMAPRFGWVNPIIIPPLSQDILSIVGMVRSGVIFTHLAASLFRAGVGFVLAVGAGVVFGLEICQWYGGLLL